jgi:hypothetical protein
MCSRESPGYGVEGWLSGVLDDGLKGGNGVRVAWMADCPID